MAGLTRSNLLKVKRFKESKGTLKNKSEEHLGSIWQALLMLGALCGRQHSFSSGADCPGAGSPCSNDKTEPLTDLWRSLIATTTFG